MAHRLTLHSTDRARFRGARLAPPSVMAIPSRILPTAFSAYVPLGCHLPSSAVVTGISRPTPLPLRQVGLFTEMGDHNSAGHTSAVASRSSWRPSFGPRTVSGFDPEQSPALAPGK